MRLHLISCEVFVREICAAISSSPHTVDVRFLPKGLHNEGGKAMRRVIQQAIDDARDVEHDAVLLGYGLCNNGLVGLRAGEKPLVAIRAHDCMTMFLGSRKKYTDFFFENPGTYFLTSGWIERGISGDQPPSEKGRHTSAYGMSWDELVQYYGEDNATYLVEQVEAETRHYSQLAYIHMGVEPDERFETESRRRASEKGWKFVRLEGNMTLIERLVNGQWDDEDFLVVPPGHEMAPTWGDDIIKAVGG
ncbi:MAG: DUF1638 domain-containing protein [Candidatus Sumerlaeia bacterium]|nr:DUF1638 domain-containing protein [Candidatus Sumerlaeia bacterium]